MQEQTFNEMPERIAGGLSSSPESSVDRRVAKALIEAELAAMKETGEVGVLTPEEWSLLAAFRKFKLRCRQGDVFRWQSGPPTPDQAEIVGRDPRDVSKR